MMARNRNVPFKGRIQKRKTYHLQIITFGLQRAAGPYRRASRRHCAASTDHLTTIKWPALETTLLLLRQAAESGKPDDKILTDGARIASNQIVAA